MPANHPSGEWRQNTVTITFTKENAAALQSLAWACGLSNIDAAAAAIRLAGATLSFTMAFHGLSGATGEAPIPPGG